MTVVEHDVQSREPDSPTAFAGVADRYSTGSTCRVVATTAAGCVAPALSKREVEVLLAWLRSDTKDEAARGLFVSASTVNTHLTRIRAKYAAVGRGANSKAGLFARALQDGLTSIEHW